MSTTRLLITHSAPELAKLIYNEIATCTDESAAFLPQTRAYAAKPGLHLRRTLKLDPVAEFFLYDIVQRNRNIFKPLKSSSRKVYGYSFKNGVIPSPSRSYNLFCKAVRTATRQYQFKVKFDIASYFNSIYHHDLVGWFEALNPSPADVLLFGKFFRQINVGRSLDCLPHGIVPAKVLGSHFLRFVDFSNRLQSDLILRFMDDFYLFADTERVITGDFLTIQRLLGEKGLHLNPSKTDFSSRTANTRRKVDKIKRNLLRRRRNFVAASACDDNDRQHEAERLSAEEVGFLLELLRNQTLSEEDAELILALIRDESAIEHVFEHLPKLLRRFPNLIKNIGRFAEGITDKTGLASTIDNLLSQQDYQMTEYQLFWLATIAERNLSATKSYGKILDKLYRHPDSTSITKARVLEIPENRFGMPDLREELLRNGGSDWSSWAAATGSLRIKRASRNHLLGYFKNSSRMNAVIADCIKAQPDVR